MTSPKKRLFTDEFRVGDKVAIIRHKHGWFDGRVVGVLKVVRPDSALVLSDDEEYAGGYEIKHPRDIKKV